MKISTLIAELQHIQAAKGDLECYLQEADTMGHESFFVVPETYRPEDGGEIVNIRSWPY